MNLEDGDWGYGAGLILAIAGGIALLFGHPILGGVCLGVAVQLCWWFG